MLRLFVAQPMKGVPDNMVRKRMYAIHDIIRKEMSEEVELLDQTTYIPNVSDLMSEDKKRNMCLANSLDILLTKANLVVFLPGWEKASGCRVEMNICQEREIEYFNEAKTLELLKKYKNSDLLQLFPEIFPKENLQTENMNIHVSSTYKVRNGYLYVSYENVNFVDGEEVAVLQYPRRAEDMSWENMTFLRIVKVKDFDKDFDKEFNILEGNPQVCLASGHSTRRLCIDIDSMGDVVEVIPKAQMEYLEPWKSLRLKYENKLENIYPLAVISDRYSGCYSGGDYTAWCYGVDYIPRGIFEDDVTCANTWGELKKGREDGSEVFGVGDTPDEALRDLIYYINRRETLPTKEDDKK